MNLLIETIEILKENKLSPPDVKFITDGVSDCSWEDFAKEADFEYNEGYGGNEISLKIKIVGEDWWLERGEYDGSEWWEFKRKPISHYDKKRMPEIKEN